MPSHETIEVAMSTPDLHRSLRIAIANLPVNENEMEASYRNKPVITKKRLQGFHNLLNDFVQCGSKQGMKIDLIVFPEVCVPHRWKPMLVSWSRKHNIGIVCGLEHRVDTNQYALNEILTTLPFKRPSGIHACLPVTRLKKTYSPEEAHVLLGNGIAIPENDRSEYPEPRFHLFHWRGVSFSVYNCYELASIEDRAIFKGKVDFLVCCEFNRDVNYFSNIVESASRDLHCYIIQANDSRYGDSRVVSPSSTILMNPVRVKGGDNVTFLTVELDLAALRLHQSQLFTLQKESKRFKPTPPGLDKKDVKKRIAFGVPE